MTYLNSHVRTIKTKIWCVAFVVILAIVVEVVALNGPNVCMVKQKYNITKRVKYRAPMSVRTYEWCFSMPPRCSKWNTEMRDLTRLETEERTAEVAVCCPGYKMKDVSCVPICPSGRTGQGCSEDCPDNKWGPNCVNVCKKCKNGFCSPTTGECECLEGWQGESCDTSMPKTTTPTMTLEELLITLTTKPSSPNTIPKVTTPSTTASTTTPTTKVKTPTTRATTTTAKTTTLPTTVITVTKEATTESTSSATTKLISIPVSTANVLTTSQISTTVKIGENLTYFSTTEAIKMMKTTQKEEYNNVTLTAIPIATNTVLPTEEVTQIIPTKPLYNRTEAPLETTTAKRSSELNTTVDVIKAIQSNNETLDTTVTTTEVPRTAFKETTLKAETKKETIRIFPTTVKFKPKEIWIRPAQKGESPIIEAKIKPTHEFPRYRSANNKDFTPVTTPKTIIVSIIPTSVSYPTFKKIALTTVSYLSQKNSTSLKSYNKTDGGLTKTISALTTSAPNTVTTASLKKTDDNSTTLPMKNITLVSCSSIPTTTPSTVSNLVTKHLAAKTVPIITNSMPDNSKTSTSVSTNISRVIQTNKSTSTVQTSTEITTKATAKIGNAITITPTTVQEVNTTNKVKETVKKTNITKIITKVTTDGPSDDEEFHILTEPEHITAVMGDKNAERSSVDLISVISIAGGVMMAVITVAVIIVMIERCKKPRYEDVRKVNDIRMQVMIDNNDVPPPYVRSIFHTPLPDPPTSEKCHYQPISTLDRNLKQFMRPVVVQTISPIMLENFRGILECHYDHLPMRSRDFGTITRCSVALPRSDNSELSHLRASVTESAIEALKCEARLDVIDNTTSEPLYAEIPCWRPPSEHAVEIMNMNGEAVTEL